MQGWRFSGAPRHGIGFGASSAAANPDLSSAGLQPDDSWFGDPLATPSLPSQFATWKRTAPTAAAALQPRAATRRRTEDPSGRLSFEDSTCGEPCQPAGSSSRAALQQVPSAALQAGRLSLEGFMPDLNVLPPGADGTVETVVAEVQRIVGFGKNDYRRVLDLQPSEWHDLQIVQSKYRRLMRLLHPDKRRKDVEARAGGKDRCDLAVRLVQEALTAAKKEAQPNASPVDPPVDPQRDLKERMRQMQEAQRRQARMSMQSQSFGGKSEASDVDSLLSEISQALGESSLPRSANTDTPSDPGTTAELINLLAGLRK